MSYEKGNVEDHYSGHREHLDGGSDRYGNDQLYGAWTVLRGGS